MSIIITFFFKSHILHPSQHPPDAHLMFQITTQQKGKQSFGACKALFFLNHRSPHGLFAV